MNNWLNVCVSALTEATLGERFDIEMKYSLSIFQDESSAEFFNISPRKQSETNLSGQVTSFGFSRKKIDAAQSFYAVLEFYIIHLVKKVWTGYSKYFFVKVTITFFCKKWSLWIFVSNLPLSII